LLHAPDAPQAAARHGAPPATPHTVPVALSGFVGRARDLAGVGALLGRARLVTLAGPGGVGKTRLAREVAAHAAASAVASTPAPVGAGAPLAGVWWIELAALPARGDVAAAVAAALGVRPAPGAPAAAESPGAQGDALADAQTDALAVALDAERLLLVLDNCEHVVEEAAAFAEALLRRCPGLTVLATSREALGVEGEVVWPVGGLAHPPLRPSHDPAGAAAEEPWAAEAVAGYEAVELFVERARAVQPGFALTAHTAPTWRRSAPGSTACRSPSSWPPPRWRR
jgi:predicted ATPase